MCCHCMIVGLVCAFKILGYTFLSKNLLGVPVWGSHFGISTDLNTPGRTWPGRGWESRPWDKKWRKSAAMRLPKTYHGHRTVMRPPIMVGPHVPKCPQLCPHAPSRCTSPQWRRLYDLDMSYMGVMAYQMVTEDVLKKKFEHPHVAVGLILVMLYLVENMCPKGRFDL